MNIPVDAIAQNNRPLLLHLELGHVKNTDDEALQNKLVIAVNFARSVSAEVGVQILITASTQYTSEPPTKKLVDEIRTTVSEFLSAIQAEGIKEKLEHVFIEKNNYYLLHIFSK